MHVTQEFPRGFFTAKRWCVGGRPGWDTAGLKGCGVGLVTLVALVAELV